MTTDFRALCAELIASWDADGCDWKPQHQARWEATVNRARAALAVPQGREPAAVTGQLSDGEVAELTGQLIEAANGAAAMGWDKHAQSILRAAELLQRQVPVPVSVSERLPGPEDCDSHGWCWVLYGAHSTWTLEPPCGQDGMPAGWTHWLPAHALPLPEVGA